MYIVKTTHSEKYQRYCRLKVNGAYIAVLQMASAVSLKLEAPSVNWDSMGNQSDPDFVQSFGEALQQAADIAREWAQDTGKDYRKVLPQ